MYSDIGEEVNDVFKWSWQTVPPKCPEIFADRVIISKLKSNQNIEDLATNEES